MKDEPVYEYIKGQGWVITSTPSFYATDGIDRRILVEYRIPKYGENYLIVRGRNQDQLMRVLRQRRYDGWYRRGNRADSAYIDKYIVLTPIND